MSDDDDDSDDNSLGRRLPLSDDVDDNDDVPTIRALPAVHGQHKSDEDSVSTLDDGLPPLLASADADNQWESMPRRLQRLNSIDSNDEATVPLSPDIRRQSQTRREIYLDDDGNVLYGDDATVTERDDEASEITEQVQRRPSRNARQSVGLGSRLAALGASKSTGLVMDDSSADSFSAEAVVRSEELRVVAPHTVGRLAGKRTKPRKHLSLGDQLARLPGASTGRYQDQSADYTSVIGDDAAAATFIITRSVMEPPPPKRSSATVASTESLAASGSQHSTAASTVSRVDGESAIASTAGAAATTTFGHLPNDAEPTADASIAAANDQPQQQQTASSLATPPVVPRTITHNSSQFQAVVLSFLANEGKVSAAHATRVIGESVHLVPENGAIFVFDYEGHIVQQLPDWLVMQLGLSATESESSCFHLNETKKIMWRLGHSTENRDGRRIQAWFGRAKSKLKLTLQ